MTCRFPNGSGWFHTAHLPDGNCWTEFIDTDGVQVISRFSWKPIDFPEERYIIKLPFQNVHFVKAGIHWDRHGNGRSNGRGNIQNADAEFSGDDAALLARKGVIVWKLWFWTAVRNVLPAIQCIWPVPLWKAWMKPLKTQFTPWWIWLIHLICVYRRKRVYRPDIRW